MVQGLTSIQHEKYKQENQWLRPPPLHASGKKWRPILKQTLISHFFVWHRVQKNTFFMIRLFFTNFWLSWHDFYFFNLSTYKFSSYFWIVNSFFLLSTCLFVINKCALFCNLYQFVSLNYIDTPPTHTHLVSGTKRRPILKGTVKEKWKGV